MKKEEIIEAGQTRALSISLPYTADMQGRYMQSFTWDSLNAIEPLFEKGIQTSFIKD
jgi:hypothetical protein